MCWSLCCYTLSNLITTAPTTEWWIPGKNASPVEKTVSEVKRNMDIQLFSLGQSVVLDRRHNTKKKKRNGSVRVVAVYLKCRRRFYCNIRECCVNINRWSISIVNCSLEPWRVCIDWRTKEKNIHSHSNEKVCYLGPMFWFRLHHSTRTAYASIN